MVEVQRRKNESFEALLRRFNRQLQMSGRILEVKKRRHFKRKPNRNARRRSALRRIEIVAKRRYLEKAGLLVEEPRRQQKK